MSKNKEHKVLGKLNKIYSADNELSIGKSVFIYLFFSFVAPALFGLLHAVYFWRESSFGQSFWDFYTGFWSVFLGSCLFILQVSSIVATKMRLIQTRIDDSLKSYSGHIDQKISEHLSKVNIVFESGINEYNDTHLLALHNALKSLEINGGNGVHVYAIDNTDPRLWWSDTMTGYLALLAKWRSAGCNSNARSISRIFVCHKNELLSPIFVKTVSLHSIMGFNTYVIDVDSYNSILSNYTRQFDVDAKRINLKKEALVWTKVNDSGNFVPISLSFSLDMPGRPKRWKNVKCYQSFWEVGSDYNLRAGLINKTIVTDLANYHGRLLNSKDIDIWFEFISKDNDIMSEEVKSQNWNELPQHYHAFIHELINQSKLCDDSNCIKEMGNKLCVEIKTYTSFSEDNIYVAASAIKDILGGYYTLLSNGQIRG